MIFIYFKYRDGLVAMHTKSSFNSIKVITAEIDLIILPKLARETIPIKD